MMAFQLVKCVLRRADGKWEGSIAELGDGMHWVDDPREAYVWPDRTWAIVQQDEYAKHGVAVEIVLLEDALGAA